MKSTSKWVVGILGTWFVLTAMTEIPATADLAAALAISVAITASFVLGSDAAKQLGSM